MKHNCYISIGSNIGNRVLNIDNSIMHLSHFSKIIKSSSYYETSPWGYIDKRDYINIILQIQTSLTPHLLLKKIKLIESKMGRKKSNLSNYSARIIDLDIIFYDNIILSDINLIIPHPKLYNRKFVLVPLCELSPNIKCPFRKETVEDILLNSDDNSNISLFKKC
ncbi:MAG: 2-amino-4-hydroxy-6-hydroxymethyldihydropteridine diphosphokinase [Flavobacteriales bacterium TMED191]|nr:MAG: 2-amino-4-hydroxy-6-hydroxymethyldihydropteridine diphosphokinase [Flavobacteriales bacterium TMED191]